MPKQRKLKALSEKKIKKYWQKGKMTEEQINLLVLAGYLTKKQGGSIIALKVIA